MELKIFKVGEFTERSFNEFNSKNIVYRYQVTDSGSIYVWFKNANKVGRNEIEEVEDIDRLIKQAETEIFAQNLQMEEAQSEIADLKQEINRYHTNQKEFNIINDRIKVAERKILMSLETIKTRERQITIAKVKLQSVLQKIK